jgi:hypothetical protein
VGVQRTGQRGLRRAAAGREKEHAHSPQRIPGPGRGLRDQRSGDLGEDARPVAAPPIGRHRAAVLESGQRRDCQVEDIVSGPAGRAGDEPGAARVVLEPPVVE